MSRLADIGLPQVHLRRLSAVWLVIPLLLLGVWELVAPRFVAVDHDRAKVAGPAIPGRGVAPLD